MRMIIALFVACSLLDIVYAAPFASIVGYIPSFDVLQNLRLDLDQRNITKVATPATDLAAAYKAYSIGKKCVLILHYD